MVFRKQYYVRAVANGPETLDVSLDNVGLFLYTDESFAEDAVGEALVFESGRWMFSIGGTGFDARLGIQLEHVGAAAV